MPDTAMRRSALYVFMFTTVFTLLTSSLPVLAQGLPEAEADVADIYVAIKSFCLVFSGICALIGSMKVYSKFSSGSSESPKAILVWFGGCAFMLMLPGMIDALIK